MPDIDKYRDANQGTNYIPPNVIQSFATQLGPGIKDAIDTTTFDDDDDTWYESDTNKLHTLANKWKHIPGVGKLLNSIKTKQEQALRKADALDRSFNADDKWTTGLKKDITAAILEHLGAIGESSEYKPSVLDTMGFINDVFWYWWDRRNHKPAPTKEEKPKNNMANVPSGIQAQIDANKAKAAKQPEVRAPIKQAAKQPEVRAPIKQAPKAQVEFHTTPVVIENPVPELIEDPPPTNIAPRGLLEPPTNIVPKKETKAGKWHRTPMGDYVPDDILQIQGRK